MSLTKERSKDGSYVQISIEGLFDFSLHKQFLASYKDEPADLHSYVIDLKHTSYVDSSALGMLLLLREYAGGEVADIKLLNTNEDVRKVLKIAHFDKIINIVD